MLRPFPCGTPHATRLSNILKLQALHSLAADIIQRDEVGQECHFAWVPLL